MYQSWSGYKILVLIMYQSWSGYKYLSGSCTSPDPDTKYLSGSCTCHDPDAKYLSGSCTSPDPETKYLSGSSTSPDPAMKYLSGSCKQSWSGYEILVRIMFIRIRIRSTLFLIQNTDCMLKSVYVDCGYKIWRPCDPWGRGRGGWGVLACLPQGVSSSDKMILPRHPSSLDFSHLTGGRRPGSGFLPRAFTPAPGSGGSGAQEVQEDQEVPEFMGLRRFRFRRWRRFAGLNASTDFVEKAPLFSILRFVLSTTNHKTN